MSWSIDLVGQSPQLIEVIKQNVNIPEPVKSKLMLSVAHAGEGAVKRNQDASYTPEGTAHVVHVKSHGHIDPVTWQESTEIHLILCCRPIG